MNVFDMIFINGYSQEIIFSSVFNYLLDSTNDHGLGNVLLKKIIDNVKQKIPAIDIDTSLQYEVEEEKYLGEGNGCIDSYIVGKKGENDEYLIGIEIKILDESSNNPRQIERYLNGLHSINETKNKLFIYLIPSENSTACLEKFKKEAIIQPEIKKTILLWKKTEKTSLPDILKKSIEEILQEILIDESIGKIAPLSIEIKFIIKSLIQTIKNDFNRSISIADPGRFPNALEFEKNIGPDYFKVFTQLRELSCSNTGKIPVIKTNHTSVGFPYSSSSTGDNTLFRVLTCANYYKDIKDKADNSRSELVIEVDYKRYESKIPTSIDGVDLIEGKSPDSEIFHPNGKGNQSVILLYINSKITTDQIRELYEFLNKNF